MKILSQKEALWRMEVRLKAMRGLDAMVMQALMDMVQDDQIDVGEDDEGQLIFRHREQVSNEDS